MGRGLTYKSKEELWLMPQGEFHDYILWMQQKARTLGTLPRKAITKDIEVALKIYNHLYPEIPLE